jgi:hypothetical protein
MHHDRNALLPSGPDKNQLLKLQLYFCQWTSRNWYDVIQLTYNKQSTFRSWALGAWSIPWQSKDIFRHSFPKTQLGNLPPPPLQQHGGRGGGGVFTSNSSYAAALIPLLSILCGSEVAAEQSTFTNTQTQNKTLLSLRKFCFVFLFLANSVFLFFFLMVLESETRA